ncbi:MAG: hypothetical protein EA384_08390 [Spirochaetaceae bacterium]|nr:MAG: hypothetical protein EA384_08390 [Spirochaetaceae bacterium]
MLIGIAGTSIIHLSKGVMKHGVERLRACTIAASASGDSATGAPVPPGGLRRRARVIYAAGVAMNFTNPLWVIVANRFAPTVYYTSMYGAGLVSLLLFSRLVLHERLDRRRLFGAMVVIAGTLLVGFSRIVTPVPAMYFANRTRVLLAAGCWALAAPLVGLLSRRGSLTLQELLFGLFGGGLASLEAVLKGVAQSGAAGSTFLPQTGANWWVFAVSFAGAAGAFGMIQWSYLRRCRVSIMAAAYDVSYVALPLLLVPLAFSGERLGMLPVAGLVVLGIGAFVIQSGPAASVPPVA